MTSTALATEVKAQQESQEYVEPIVTEQTIPNAVGDWDLRVNLEYQRDKGETTVTLPKLALFFGINDRLGAEINLPFIYHQGKETEGYDVGALAGSFTYMLINPGSTWPVLAIGTEFAFPTGGTLDGPAERSYEVSPFLAYLQDFRFMILQGRIGWSVELPQEEDENPQDFTYGWAAAFPIWNKQAYVFTEINGTAGLNHPGNPISFAPGFKYYLTEELFVATSVPIGLTQSAADYGLTAQLQVRF